MDLQSLGSVVGPRGNRNLEVQLPGEMESSDEDVSSYGLDVWKRKRRGARNKSRKGWAVRPGEGHVCVAFWEPKQRNIPRRRQCPVVGSKEGCKLTSRSGWWKPLGASEGMGQEERMS